VPNYELEATGKGFWRRGQEHITAGYVERYFADVPGLADVHQGWLLPRRCRGVLSRLAFDQAVEPARRTIAMPGLHASLGRRLVECLDRLERAVAVRALM
jgi:aminopeptidase N